MKLIARNMPQSSLAFLFVSFRIFILFALLSVSPVRADMVLEQQFSDADRTHIATLKLHDDKMRLDEQDGSLSVIVDLKSRDSYTLINTNKTYLMKFGSEVRWEMKEEQKINHGTNDMDAPPAPPVNTGKVEAINGYNANIYAWGGAHGLMETLWVVTNFPNYAVIRTELAELDRFNDSGPHRNAQPQLSLLPGMVVKTESVYKGHKMTISLKSVKVESVDPSLFELPPGYTQWRPPKTKQ